MQRESPNVAVEPRRRVRRRGIGFALSLALLATADGIASGSDTPSVQALGAARPGDLYEGAETIVVEGSSGALRPALGSVASTAIEADDLAAQPGSLLTDRLVGVPGVHLQTTTPGQGSPYLNGLTGSSVLTVVDGMRLNHAFYRSAPNPYLALVDPYAVRRMRIIRGPASVRFGSDAMGGVIEIDTRRPYFDDEHWSTHALASVRLDSTNRSATSHVEAQTGRRGLGFHAGLSYGTNGDLRGGDGRQEPTGYDWIGVDAALSIDDAKGRRTTATIQYVEQPESPRYDELVAGFGQTSPASEVWQLEPLTRLFTTLRHDVADPLPGVDSLSLGLGYQRITDDRRTRDFGSATERRERNRSDQLGANIRARSLAGSRLAIGWGVDAYWDRVHSRRSERDDGVSVGTPIPARFPDGSRMDSYGLFAEAEISLCENVDLNLGIRYSFFDIEVASTGSTAERDLFVDDFTGGLGILWRVRPALELYANARRGFRAPNLFDLGTLGDRPGNRFNLPNPALDPETIHVGDLGFRRHGSTWRIEGNAFFAYYADKIDTVLTGATTPSGREVVTSDNLGRVQIAGLLAALAWEWRTDLELDLHLQYTWGRQSTGGERSPADRIPPLQGRLGLRWDVTERLWAEPYLRGAWRQDRLSDRDERDPRIDPRGTDAWITLNARLGWTPTDAFSLFASVVNVTDARYREHGSGIDGAGAGVLLGMELRRR